MAALDVAIQTYDMSEVGAVVGHLSFAHPVRLDVSTTYAKGQILALKPSSVNGTYVKYVRGASDGTQLAECILRRACVTDANGNITYVGTVSEYGDTQVTTSAWFGGVFRMVDLNATGANGLDAAGATAMGGRVYRNGAEFKF